MFKTFDLFKKVHDADIPEQKDLEYLLSLDNEREISALYEMADNTRKRFMGDGIFLRGLLEFSNFCKNKCMYCGLNRNNKALERYRLRQDEILEAAGLIVSSGIKTVVLQSGEDERLDPAEMADTIKKIRSMDEVAVTLSVGERPRRDYKLWKDAGAERYLLKIEASDKKLYESLHPGMSFENRLRCLKNLRDLGYQTGCGNIIGLKGQTVGSIARDIIFFKKQKFEMIGIGPFIPHEKTALAKQAKGSVALTLKTVALTRIVTKTAHLPATTALGSIGKDFRPDALKAGANVLMPNFTPQPYKRLYEIYPAKRCVSESQGSCAGCMDAMAKSVGRYIDHSRGDALKHE